ncbi:alpha/beta fold hydrolase [Cellulomonas phragmiteti]|uniref:Dihydrolipoamide acetyltransferase n=1 Tax=Cellulomonas phragmiteti TaxID=478780 RepID=A0ABQ4DG04_9CELL|nr:alpha/beta fold hydrolase [Cellulomonas phragmiteti]GIG38269.1 dihydrolipoamide acetyltransferase [Cellulomonas phragmiteti]
MALTVREPRPERGTVVGAQRWRIDGVALRTWTVQDPVVDEVPLADRRDFVLVHGLGASSATFERLAPHLARVGTVHLVDLPGFARVPRPSGGLEVADLARVVTGWAERAGVQGATFVGHSMGAQVVAEALAASPDLASHGVLVGPTVDERAPTAGRQMLRLARSGLAESAAVRAVLVRGTLECGPRWYVTELRRMLRHDVAARVRAVEAPLLMVRGEHDHVAPAAWVAGLAATAPRGRAATVPGAAHAAMYTHGREVADLVLAHVAG